MLQEAEQRSPTGLGRSIWTLPAVPCLESRCRVVAEAIDDGSLPHGRADAKAVDSGMHLAYERRHIYGET